MVTTIADPNREDSLLSVGEGTCGDADEAEISVPVDSEGAVHLSTSCTSE